jgi:hypothetical protein
MHTERTGFDRLEGLVADALDSLASLRDRALSAEARVRDLEEALERHEAAGGASEETAHRLGAYQAENRELRGRLTRGREGVERLLARIRFLEEQR